MSKGKMMAFLQNITRTERGCLLIFDTRANPEAMAEFIGQEITLEIKTGKDRSLSQNNLLWTIIGAIDQKQNGRKSKDGSIEIYRQILKLARVKTEWLQTPTESKSRLTRMFQVIIEHKVETNDKGNEIGTYECYWGSSHLNTKEMSDVIETALDYAERAGVDTTYYRDEWRGIIGKEK